MKYYSEDDVMDLIREAEDCERAYEWGEGHKRIHFEDYHPIEIPDKHGRLIDADAEIVKLKAFMKCLNKETESGGRQYHECYCVLHYLTALVEATE